MRAALFLLLLVTAFAPRAEYANAAAWNEDATTLGFQIDTFDKCRGRLAEKPRFSACIQLWEDAYRRQSRMARYAQERVERDPGNFEAVALSQRSGALGEKLDAAAAFLQPEIRKLGRTKVTQLVASQKGLAKYKAPLDAVIRAKPGAPVDARTLWKE